MSAIWSLITPIMSFETPTNLPTEVEVNTSENMTEALHIPLLEFLQEVRPLPRRYDIINELHYSGGSGLAIPAIDNSSVVFKIIEVSFINGIPFKLHAIASERPDFSGQNTDIYVSGQAFQDFLAKYPDLF